MRLRRRGRGKRHHARGGRQGGCECPDHVIPHSWACCPAPWERATIRSRLWVTLWTRNLHHIVIALDPEAVGVAPQTRDRTRVGQGTSVSVRVDVGGSRKL